MRHEIQVLKDNPNLSLHRVAVKLGMDSSELGRIQREYYKPFLKRDSKLWGANGSGVLCGRVKEEE